MKLLSAEGKDSDIPLPKTGHKVEVLIAFPVRVEGMMFLKAILLPVIEKISKLPELAFTDKRRKELLMQSVFSDTVAIFASSTG